MKKTRKEKIKYICKTNRTIDELKRNGIWKTLDMEKALKEFQRGFPRCFYIRNEKTKNRRAVQRLRNMLYGQGLPEWCVCAPPRPTPGQHCGCPVPGADGTARWPELLRYRIKSKKIHKREQIPGGRVKPKLCLPHWCRCRL